MSVFERIVKSLLLLGVIVILYGPTLSYDLVYDDIPHISQNAQVTDPSHSWITIVSEPTHPGNLYRPLTTLSYRLTWQIFGADRSVFHLSNLLLHWLCAVLLGSLIFRLTQLCNTAFLTSLLFAIHPLAVESVASVVGRAELLAALGTFVAVLSALASSTSAFRPRALIIPFLALLFAMLSKESGLVGVLLLPAARLWWDSQRGAPKRASVRAASMLFAIGLAAAAVALLLRTSTLGGTALLQCDATRVYPENPICQLAFTQRLVPALNLLGQYLVHILIPCGLSADYSQGLGTLQASTYSFLGALRIGLVIMLLGVGFLTRTKLVGGALLWFFVAFACTANVLFPIGTLMADRLAYLPMCGALACLAYYLTVERVTPFSRLLQRVATPLAIAFFALAASGRVAIWRDGMTLYTATLRDSPLSPKAHYNLAIALLTDTRDTAAADAYLKRAYALNDQDPRITRALAEVAIARNEPWRVEYWLKRTLELEPGDRTAQQQLGELERLKHSYPLPRAD